VNPSVGDSGGTDGRAQFAMPHGPAGTGKAAAEQRLVDEVMDKFPALFSPGWIWLMDRNYHGAARIAGLSRPRTCRSG
jgi:hypothetical protein